MQAVTEEAMEGHLEELCETKAFSLAVFEALIDEHNIQ